MRCTVFSVIVIIFILGFLANESTPAPPWSPFNLVTTDEIATRARGICFALYPFFETIGNDKLFTATMRWVPEAIMETFYLNRRLEGVIRAFQELAPPQEMDKIIEGVKRLFPEDFEIGRMNAIVNRPLNMIAGLNGDETQKKYQQLTVECLLRVGYVLNGHQSDPYFKVTETEAWTIIMSWLMQYDSSTSNNLLMHDTSNNMLMRNDTMLKLLWVKEEAAHINSASHSGKTTELKI